MDLGCAKKATAWGYSPNYKEVVDCKYAASLTLHVIETKTSESPRELREQDGGQQKTRLSQERLTDQLSLR